VSDLSVISWRSTSYRYIAPFENFILTPSQPVYTLTPKWYVLSG